MMPRYFFEKDGETLEIECSSDDIEARTEDLLKKGYERVFSLNMISGRSTGRPKGDGVMNKVLDRIKRNSGSGCTIRSD